MPAGRSIGADLTSVDPAPMIARLDDRPVLLIHASADVLDRPERSAEDNLAAARAARVQVELHYCPDGTHGKVIGRCPAEWTAWATGFLSRVTASAPATGR